jgi:Family of unknown function (DUF5973)
MSASLSETHVDLDEILYQSVVDEAFRTQLLADPSLLGLGAQSVTLPAPVESQNTAALDLTSGASYITMCASTCSGGPFTIVCDGTTK